MSVFIYRCRDCQHGSPVMATLAQDSVLRAGRCELCGGPVELARRDSSHFSGIDGPRDIADRLHLRDAWLMVGETWYAWRASRRMLEWYQRVRSEESGLAGRALYEHVITRRSGVDTRAAESILRHAEQSFCAWPVWRELTYRDVVLYVVVHEYLRSHEANLGTQTRMGTIVARVIPKDL